MPDERELFGAFVRRYGTPRPGPGTPAAQQVPNGACWDATWVAAEKNNSFYVEGICILTPSKPGERYGVVNAHAWEEKMTPFGLQIIEHTIGYENVKTYIGVRLNREAARPATVTWGPERSSIIEVSIDTGWSTEQILNRLVLPAAR